MESSFKQKDFTWQEFWRTSILLFRFRWNDHLLLLFSNTLLWIQQKFITFKVFLCRILIIGWNNKWIHHTSNNMLSVTLIYRQEVASLFQVQGKFKACQNSKWTFSNSCFIAGDSHIKIIWLHRAVFNKHYILHLANNVHLLKHYPMKAHKTFLIRSIAQTDSLANF